jgi:hypothetical protein
MRKILVSSRILAERAISRRVRFEDLQETEHCQIAEFFRSARPTRLARTLPAGRWSRLPSETVSGAWRGCARPACIPGRPDLAVHFERLTQCRGSGGPGPGQQYRGIFKRVAHKQRPPRVDQRSGRRQHDLRVTAHKPMAPLGGRGITVGFLPGGRYRRLSSCLVPCRQAKAHNARQHWVEKGQPLLVTRLEPRRQERGLIRLTRPGIPQIRALDIERSDEPQACCGPAGRRGAGGAGRGCRRRAGGAG